MIRLPAILLFVALVSMWLALNDAREPGHWLLAVGVALAVQRLARPLAPRGARLRRLPVLLKLVMRVGADVIVSALQVGAGALRPASRPATGAFVTVPLALRDPYALTALAVICTVVPGSLWSELAPDRSVVLLHVFGVEDEAAYVHDFKTRYEQPLMEIFE